MSKNVCILIDLGRASVIVRIHVTFFFPFFFFLSKGRLRHTLLPSTS